MGKRQIGVHLADEDRALLDLISLWEGLNMSQAIRRMIRIRGMQILNAATQEDAIEQLRHYHFARLVEHLTGAPIGEHVQPNEALTAAVDEQLDLLAVTHSREVGILRVLYGLDDNASQPKMWNEVGEMYGVSTERIRQISSRALSRLRHPARFRPVRDFIQTSQYWEVP